MRSYSLGSMETKKWFMFSGKMLARCGTGAWIGGKDVGGMEDTAQGRQAYSDGGLYWEARGAGTRIPWIMGAMEGSSLGVSLSTLSQQVSSTADQEGDEPLLPRVDVLSLVPLSAAVVSGLDVEPSSFPGAPYTLF